jgi:predicted RNA-binding Zn-ribbon protein involved in translation (DUF1610 family)
MAAEDLRTLLDQSLGRLSPNALASGLASLLAEASRLCPDCGAKARIRSSRERGPSRVANLQCRCGWRGSRSVVAVQQKANRGST